MANIPASIGKYTIVKEIASGSFGRVYLGEDTSRQNYPVAIKFMQGAHLASAQERSGFLQEAQLLTLLRHPYIVPVLDLGLEEGIPYLVMEYAPGGSLAERLKAQSPRALPVQEALILLGQVGSALQYAHQQNVIHRDLKPANILFNARGDALLADFGIATMLSSSIKSGAIVGTPYYMAPEQFRGTVSKEGDQYALGCIAYQTLTGRLPYEAADFFALGFKHMSDTPLAPTQLNLLVPYPVEAAIMKAIAKDRLQRFNDVNAFISALGAPVSAPVQILPVTPILSPADSFTTGPMEEEEATLISGRSSAEHNPLAAPARSLPEEEAQPVFSANNYAPGNTQEDTTLVREFEGQQLGSSGSGFPVYLASVGDQEEAPLAGVRESEGQSSLASSAPQNYLVKAPDQKDVSLDVLPQINSGPPTPLPASGINWAGVVSNPPDRTVFATSAEEEGEAPRVEHTLLTTPALSLWNQSAASDPAVAHEQMVIGLGSSIPPNAQTWPQPPQNLPLPPQQQQDKRKSGRRVSPLLIAAICALLIVLIGGGVVFAIPGAARDLKLTILPEPPKAQITITPTRTALDTIYSISAITGSPSSNKRQVQARNLSSSSDTASITVRTTGVGTVAATNAVGKIYIINNLTNSTINFSAGFSFGAGGGVTFYLSEGHVLQPSGQLNDSYNFSAYAAPAGSIGNISTTHYWTISCANGVTDCANASSNSFGGGTDASHYPVVTQNDINAAQSNASSAYYSSELADAQTKLKAQVASHERILNGDSGISCSASYTVNHNAGDHFGNVTAWISVSCSAEVYEYDGALTLARSLMQQSIAATQTETQVGKITASMLNPTAGSNGTINLKVETRGAEVYTFSNEQLLSLAGFVAYMDVADAQTFLARQTGVTAVTVTVTGGNGKTLPKVLKDITFSINPITS